LRLDLAGPTEIDGDRADELTMCRRRSADYDVYRVDLRSVRRDGREEAVLGVRAFVGGDWNVDT
jgi:hypothetical protein